MGRSSKIIIDDKLCKGCGLCVDVCPKQVLRLSNEVSSRGYNISQVIAAENCIKCRKCELACPELSIWLEFLEEPKSDQKCEA